MRSIVIFTIFILVGSLLTPFFGGANTRALAVVFPDVVMELTNNERKSQNLPTLNVNSVLNQAAQAKATDMATKGYFAHTSPEGKTPWYWLDLQGYQYQYAGENLAVNFTESKDVVRGWMESPTHRANIVQGNYSEVGTGVASGLYEGREAIFVVQFYTNPLPNNNVQNPPAQSIFSIEAKTPAPEEIQKQIVEEESTEVLGVKATTKTAELNVVQEVEQPIVLAEAKAPAPEEIPKQIIEEESTEILITNKTDEIVVEHKVTDSPSNTTNFFLVAVSGFLALALFPYTLNSFS